jgi:hypothetical protein
MYVERARSQTGIVVPDGLQKHISGLHNTPVLDQVAEQQKLARGKLDSYTRAPQVAYSSAPSLELDSFASSSFWQDSSDAGQRCGAGYSL